MTNSPRVTVATLEQNADALASALKQLNLSIVASSTAIGVIHYEALLYELQVTHLEYINGSLNLLLYICGPVHV